MGLRVVLVPINQTVLMHSRATALGASFLIFLLGWAWFCLVPICFASFRVARAIVIDFAWFRIGSFHLA